MTKRLVTKKINAYSTTWTAPANVKSISVSVQDDFNKLLTCGSDYGAILKRTGIVWSVGSAGSGQIGDGTSSPSKSTLVPVIGANSFIQISAGLTYTTALKADGSVWAWGANSSGQLGDGTNLAKSVPTASIGGHSFIQIGLNEFNVTTCALKSDGSVWTWGSNSSGRLGDGTTAVNTSSPIQVIGGHSFIQIGSSLALKADGSAWGWGGNTAGQLADGTNISKSSPVAAIGGHSFIQILSGSSHTLALKSNGSAWGWGSNPSGALGDGTSVNKSSPVQVIGGHSFVQVAAGGNTSFALKEDGSAWAWGSGFDGQLGDGTIFVNKSSPVQVIGGHSFIQIEGGEGHTYALKANGTTWAWGQNTSGELGDGTTSGKSSPVQMLGGQLFEAGSIFINKTIIEVIPGTSYNLNFFLIAIGSQLFRNYNTRNNVSITLEYYV